MATDASFAEYVLEQVALPGRADVRKMFGEYALYVDGKVVALLCDDQFFLKWLQPLRARLARVDEAPPYPGAKPYFRIVEELERPGELTALVVEAARLLPVPKPKPKPNPKARTRQPAKAPTRTRVSKPVPASKARAQTPAAKKSHRRAKTGGRRGPGGR